MYRDNFVFNGFTYSQNFNCVHQLFQLIEQGKNGRPPVSTKPVSFQIATSAVIQRFSFSLAQWDNLGLYFEILKGRSEKLSNFCVFLYDIETNKCTRWFKYDRD